MIDVLLTQTGDGFEITVSGGLVQLTGGIETAIVLSLAGGNIDDNGSDATEALQYWANFAEQVPARRLRSQTAALLQNLPAVTGNLRRVEEAVRADCAWLADAGIVKEIAVAVTMDAPRRARIEVRTPLGAVTIRAPWMG